MPGSHHKKAILLLTMCLLTGCSLYPDNIKHPDSNHSGAAHRYDKYEVKKEFNVIFESSEGRKVVSDFKTLEFSSFDTSHEYVSYGVALREGYLAIEDIWSQKTLNEELSTKKYKVYAESAEDIVIIVVCYKNDLPGDVIIGTGMDAVNQCK